ncbi:MAG TPA: DinB family protein [Pyrinomonadaceae bacterium]|nr:DinB family protein [Pyrinomonadaceae bacterium]
MPLRMLTPYPGLSREIGLYLSGMEEVREQVRAAVAGLSNEEIGRPAFLGAHPIGALVLHIGEAEWWWMKCIVSGHELTEHDRKAPYWDVLNDPQGFASHNYSAQFCLEQIETIRNQTRDLLFARNDKDLEHVHSLTRKGVTTDHTLRWILHHLIDHEAQHKGQILMLRRLWV